MSNSSLDPLDPFGEAPIQPSYKSQSRTVQVKSSDLNKVYSFKGVPTFEKFYNDDSNWGAFVVITDEKLPGSKRINTYNYKDNTYKDSYQINLTGKTIRLTSGMEFSIKAKLTDSKKYGYGYEIISVEQETPKSVEQQQKFLQTLVTENQAKVLLEVYPDIIQMIIDGQENEIDLNKTKGIKEFTFNLIKNKIIENYAIADVLVLLAPLGISFNKIKKLLNDEPNPAILKQRLLDDPYIIVDVPGISFKTADSIALKMKPEFVISRVRVIAFLKHFLKELGESAGHTWVTYGELELAVKENIIECKNLFDEFLIEELEKQNNGLENRCLLHIEEDRVGLFYYWNTEKKLWDKLNVIYKSEPMEISNESIEEGIKKAEEKQGFPFTEEQKEVIINSTKNNLSIITGRAGVGKTSIARGILNIYDHANKSIACCSLSAKAAKRITEASGFPATTIHRLLGATGANQFAYDETNHLDVDVVFCDESSMIYTGLFYYLVRALKPGTKLILSGDSSQLSPISWGNPFADILQKDLEINKLTKILRQSERSGIIKDANLVREGIDPLEGKKSFKTVSGELQDLVYMFRSDKYELRDIAIRTYLKTIEDPKYGLDNCYILTMRKDNAVNSTREINKIIQDKLISKDVPSMKFGDSKEFRQGARVIHIINDYERETFNGDMGTITYFGQDEDGDFFEVDYGDKQTIYHRENLNELELAYCLTTHKFQGSESKVIIGLLDSSAFLLLDRTALYTMLTRGKEKVLLLAEPFAYDRAIFEDHSGSRKTWTLNF